MMAPMTMGDVARHFGLQTWQVSRLYERGDLPEPARAGRMKVVYEHELPAIEAALIARGYLKMPAPAMAS